MTFNTEKNSDLNLEKHDLIKFSAGGLRDFSRIAASNEVMWRDIFLDNILIIPKVKFHQ